MTLKDKEKFVDVFIYLIISFLSINFLNNIFLLDSIYQIDIKSLLYGKFIPEFGGHFLIDFISMSISAETFQKLIFFMVLLLGGYSVHILYGEIISSKGNQLYTVLLYIFNPYTYIRVLTGQLYLIFSYVMISLSLKVFIDLLEKQQNKEMIKFTFILSVVAFNIHMLIISLIIMTIIFIFWFGKHKDIRITRYLALSVIIFILLNSYWIIPVLTAKNTIVDNITDKDYEAFSPKGSLFDIAAMYGFWREGHIYAKDFIPGWQILYLIILSLTIIGFFGYYKDDKIGYLVMAFGSIAILGLILALGIKGPLSILYEFDSPILKGFRDSHKFVAMMVLSYSVLGGLGVNKIKGMYDSRVAYNEIRCKKCKKILSEDDKICPICGCNNKIYSVSTELKVTSNLSVGMEIKRGDKSWNYFVVAWGILSVTILTVEAEIDIPSHFKIISILSSIIFITYLCFFNKCIRNKIVSIMSKSQDMTERY